MPSLGISNFKFWTINHNAFTLVEVMISISIIAILTIAAIPSFSGFSRSQAMAQAFKSLKSDIRIAQSRSLSGATVSGAAKAWGISITDGSSQYNIFVCTPAQISSDYTYYRFGDPTLCSSTPYKTVDLGSSIRINGISPVIGGKLDLVFDSQNGSVYANGVQTNSSISVSYMDGTGTQTINVTSSGGVGE